MRAAHGAGSQPIKGGTPPPSRDPGKGHTVTNNGAQRVWWKNKSSADICFSTLKPPCPAPHISRLMPGQSPPSHHLGRPPAEKSAGDPQTGRRSPSDSEGGPTHWNTSWGTSASSSVSGSPSKPSPSTSSLRQPFFLLHCVSGSPGCLKDGRGSWQKNPCPNAGFCQIGRHECERRLVIRG